MVEHATDLPGRQEPGSGSSPPLPSRAWAIAQSLHLAIDPTSHIAVSELGQLVTVESGYATRGDEAPKSWEDAVKGDRVEIVIDSGDGATRTYEIAATRAGRRVEVTTGRGIVEVSEVTRTGTAVRAARFMASRVVAVVEHPADTAGAG